MNLFCFGLPTSTSPFTITTRLSSHHSITETVPSSTKNFSPQRKISYGFGKNIASGSFSPVPNSSWSCLAARTTDHDQKSEIQLPESLRPELMPKHVALITDGHGRWAEKRGLPVQQGHGAGVENLKQMVLQCSKFGIRVFTAFLFSTENWKRPKEEVDFLMKVYDRLIRYFVNEQVTSHDLRFSVIGDKSRLPQFIQSTISSTEESAKGNKGTHFVMALSYSGQYDILEASRKIAGQVENGKLRAKDIDKGVFEQQLLTNTITPDPDLLIRTSGEIRISNFMLWQMAYTEFYFANKLFPDFKESDFVDALNFFQQRQRRFGERKN
uniref:Alkyl transferase n=1 Tax=Eremophila drummondii TaxID=2652523 RepID=A0A6G9KST6_9LAMI|nr:cis-prenyl transferase 2 [Eremophila drummondii]